MFLKCGRRRVAAAVPIINDNVKQAVAEVAAAAAAAAAVVVFVVVGSTLECQSTGKWRDYYSLYYYVCTHTHTDIHTYISYILPACDLTFWFCNCCTCRDSGGGGGGSCASIVTAISGDGGNALRSSLSEDINPLLILCLVCV